MSDYLNKIAAAQVHRNFKTTEAARAPSWSCTAAAAGFEEPGTPRWWTGGHRSRAQESSRRGRDPTGCRWREAEQMDQTVFHVFQFCLRSRTQRPPLPEEAHGFIPGQKGALSHLPKQKCVVDKKFWQV